MTDAIEDGIDARMRAILERAPLPDGVRLERVADADWRALTRPFLKVAFADRTWIDRDRLHDEAARAATEPLVARERELLRHRYALRHGKALVGVYEGWQRPEAIYEMNLTALAPEWRRRGIYRALLRAVIDACRAAGFLAIESRHAADNNPILIAKLREGFVIDGTLVSLGSGLQVRLMLYLHESGRARFRGATSVNDR